MNGGGWRRISITGFDLFTSKSSPEQIARLISVSICLIVKDICPLYDRCDIDKKHMKFGEFSMHECYDKLCKYFDKEIES